MKKTQNGTTPATSEEGVSAEYELISYMAIKADDREVELISYMAIKADDREVDEWEVKQGWVGPEGIAPLVLVHYPVQKGWEVSLYMGD